MYGINTQRPLNLHPLLSFLLEDLSYLEVKMLKKSTVMYMYIESKKAYVSYEKEQWKQPSFSFEKNTTAYMYR